MIPKIIQAYEQKLPSELNYWFINENGQIKVLSDAIKSPGIHIDKEVKIEGEWIYKRDHYVVRKGEEKEEVIYSNTDAIDFLHIDNEVRPVERKGKSVIFNGEKYLAFYRKFGFSTLENKNKILIFTNNQEIELDKPIGYRITPLYVNLVYDSYSIIVNTSGSKSLYNRPDFYLGTSSKGKIFQTLSGKIVTEGEYDLLGVCTSDTYYLGEASIGLVLVCDKKLKYYYRGGWAYLSNTSNLLANFVNYNYVIITDTHTNIHDGNLKKLFDLNNIHSIIADRKYIYIISSSRKIYIIEPTSDYFPLEILHDSHGVIVTVDKGFYASLKLGKGLIKVSEANDGEKVTIRVEPSRLSVTTQSKIEVSNELFVYNKDIVIQPLGSELSLLEGYILLTKNGRAKNVSEYYNAILKSRIKYKIPSKLGSIIKLKVLGKEYSFSVTNSEGELSINIPIVKFNSNEEVLFLSLERNGFVETSKEYVIKVKEVKESRNYRTVQQIENTSRRIITKSEDGYFEWVRVEEYQDIYDNVIIAKEGDMVTIGGERFKIKTGSQKITIQKDNYVREYFAYGLPNPVKSIVTFLQNNKLVINIDLTYKLPITVIYGTQIETSFKGEFIFDLDPAYSTVIIKAYYSENIKWEFNYKIVELIKSILSNAGKISTIIKEQLNNYGIL